MEKNTYKKRSKAVYISEYMNDGVTWMRIQHKDFGTEVILPKEEWERRGNK